MPSVPFCKDQCMSRQVLFQLIFQRKAPSSDNAELNPSLRSLNWGLFLCRLCQNHEAVISHESGTLKPKRSKPTNTHFLSSSIFYSLCIFPAFFWADNFFNGSLIWSLLERWRLHAGKRGCLQIHLRQPYPELRSNLSALSRDPRAAATHTLQGGNTICIAPRL